MEDGLDSDELQREIKKIQEKFGMDIDGQISKPLINKLKSLIEKLTYKYEQQRKLLSNKNNEEKKSKEIVQGTHNRQKNRNVMTEISQMVHLTEPAARDGEVNDEKADSAEKRQRVDEQAGSSEQGSNHLLGDVINREDGYDAD